MQGAIQKWVDHSISVTVNLPNEVSEELVGRKSIRTAWERGCKGVTVYRDGSPRRRAAWTRNRRRKGGRAKRATADGSLQTAPQRPLALAADIVRFKNGQEEWIAFVGI